jgi:hypothetical protein
MTKIIPQYSLAPAKRLVYASATLRAIFQEDFLLMRHILALAGCLLGHAALAAVTISPPYAQLAPGQSLTFTSATPGVIWQVNNGNGSGITTSGVYTAPATPPAPAVATITAVSPTDPSDAATATVTLLAAPLAGKTWYVAPGGSDTNPGTIAAPFATLQHAAALAGPGDTVLARAGTYRKLLSLTKSGTATAPITFASYPGETAIIDGTKLAIPNGQNGLITLNSVSDVIIEGFQLQNYTTASLQDVPIGIYVTGAGDGVQIVANRITKITTTAKTNPNQCGSNALGVAVYGSAAPAAITNLVISGNQLDHLLTGCSESMSIDGNVDGYVVLSNLLHDNDNIGIDSIGFEGVSPNPAYDQARNGEVRGNLVYNITSVRNPDYNSTGADGIYVDGGTQIVIEQNTVYKTDLGIELASEHKNHATSYVIARNNLVYDSTTVGISIGGYAASKGGTDHVTVVNNTLSNNDTTKSGSGEFQVQFNATNNAFENNILYANNQCLLVNDYTSSTSAPVSIDYNDYYCSPGASQAQFVWQKKTITGFPSWLKDSAQDTHSLFANPDYADAAAADFDVTAASPALGAADDLGGAVLGMVDYAGNPRIGGSGLVTIGTYENSAP